MHFLTAAVAAFGLAGTSLAIPTLVARDEFSAVDVAQAPLPTILLSKLLDGTALVPGGSSLAVTNGTSPDTPVARRRNSWHLTTYVATSCEGKWVGWTWADGVDSTCIVNDQRDWHSLRVDNFGGCFTKYFSGRGCGGDGVEVTNSECKGFTKAEPIRSVLVTCYSLVK
ncbi:hypothetical protein RB595_003951 [Gaeumannomyces hyphopodioides]